MEENYFFFVKSLAENFTRGEEGRVPSPSPFCTPLDINKNQAKGTFFLIKVEQKKREIIYAAAMAQMYVPVAWLL